MPPTKQRQRRQAKRAFDRFCQFRSRTTAEAADPTFEQFEQMVDGLRSRQCQAAGEIRLRMDTLNVEGRSVEAVVATSDPVPMFDVERWDIIDELLTVEGMEPTEHVSLLNSHRRYSHDDVYGSVDQIRAEPQDGAIVGRLTFAEATEDDQGRALERTWRKVRDKHIRSVSAGYRIHEYQDIKPHQTAMIKGRTYTAGDRLLRVATRWSLREVSVVVIGADPRATTRSDSFNDGVNPVNLRAYLESLGLRTAAAIDELVKFYADLKGDQRQRADELASDAEKALLKLHEEKTRAAQQATPPAAVTPQNAGGDGGSVTDPAVAAVQRERERVAQIQQICDGQFVEIEREAVNNGWDTERTSREVLNRMRSGSSQQSQQDTNQSNIGIHSRSSADHNQDVLAVAMMVGHGGLRLDSNFFGSELSRMTDIPSVMRQDINSPDRQRTMELAYRLRSRSMLDLCSDALRLAGRSVPDDRNERIRAAMSTAELNFIFSTNVNARLLGSYQETADSTMGWCSEVDRPDYKQNDVGILGKMGQLTRRAAGTNPDQQTMDAKYESYKVAEYAGEFSVDRQDIINDSFGALERMTPEEMGAAARRLRPDLVYSTLLANAALDADSTALFHSDHSNTYTGALASSTLEQYLAAMMNQRQNGAPLNVVGRYLIVNPLLKYTARQLIKPDTRTSASGDYNPLVEDGLELRVDTRIGAGGVSDPSTDPATAYQGSATLFYISARPGENGAKTIEVGYLRGLGRAPEIIGWMSPNGLQMNWTVTMSIGVKPLDYRGLVRSTGGG